MMVASISTGFICLLTVLSFLSKPSSGGQCVATDRTVYTPSNGCEHSLVVCTGSWHYCSPLCSGNSSCVDLTFECATGNNCTLTCDGPYACANVVLECPAHPVNWIHDATLHCGLVCHGPHACDNVTVNARRDEAYISCTGQYGCRGITVDHAEAPGGSLYVSFDSNASDASFGSYAPYGSDPFDTPWRTFEDALFKCPLDGPCVFSIAYASEVMHSARIEAESSSLVSIDCGGYASFSYASFNLTQWTENNLFELNPCAFSLNATGADKVELLGGPAAFANADVICPYHVNARGYACELHGVRPLASWLTNSSNSLNSSEMEALRAFATFAKTDFKAWEGLQDVVIDCDDKVRDFYGDANAGWMHYTTDAPDELILQDTGGYYAQRAVGCMDQSRFYCGNKSLGTSGTTGGSSACALGLGVNGTYQVMEGSDAFTADDVVPSPWEGLNWICAESVSTGEYMPEYSSYCLEFESMEPTLAPTVPPTGAPSQPPTKAPSGAPSIEPSVAPTMAPVLNPTHAPVASPTSAPVAPTGLYLCLQFVCVYECV